MPLLRCVYTISRLLFTILVVSLADILLSPQFRSASSLLSSRQYSTEKDLKQALAEKIPLKREQLKKLKTEHGQKSLGEVTVESTLGGMRYVNPKFPTGFWL